MFNLAMFWLQQQGTGGGFVQIIFLVVIFAIFYFLLIRPMRVKQKKLSQLIKELKKGDKIVTTGGIYGTIAGLTDSTLLVKIADNVKIEIARSAVAGLQPEKK
jgi:preprotein translocase subunit YajC